MFLSILKMNNNYKNKSSLCLQYFQCKYSPDRNPSNFIQNLECFLVATSLRQTTGHFTSKVPLPSIIHSEVAPTSECSLWIMNPHFSRQLSFGIPAAFLYLSNDSFSFSIPYCISFPHRKTVVKEMTHKYILYLFYFDGPKLSHVRKNAYGFNVCWRLYF